jgi:NAD(P)-dependent dehydrogenase (short-subunit alcohol dehydrogenase family)
MEIPFKADLKGKMAVVTGGGGILCSVMARALAACGASVAVLDIDIRKADIVAEAINRDGGRARGFSADVLDAESLRGVEAEIVSLYGPCGILVNGAGGNNPRATTDDEFHTRRKLHDRDGEVLTFFNLEPEEVQSVFSLNFMGTLIPTQIFSEKMASGGGGVIINISSLSAFMPLTKIPAYSAAKAAVSNFTQWLAVHFSDCGIRVNAIAPGFFITEQNRSLLLQGDGGYTTRASRIISLTPGRRLGRPEELLGTLLWLADDGASGFVNGTVVPVDGGFSAYHGV